MAKTVAVGDVDLSDVIADVKRRTEVVLTEDGEPIARVIPVENPLRGPMYGTLTFFGDIVEPLDEEWKAEQ
jgi:antitoxin (DNA-binding transcriptional repressor) of toxin-antitoxin stability system